MFFISFFPCFLALVKMKLWIQQALTFMMCLHGLSGCSLSNSCSHYLDITVKTSSKWLSSGDDKYCDQSYLTSSSVPSSRTKCIFTKFASSSARFCTWVKAIPSTNKERIESELRAALWRRNSGFWLMRRFTWDSTGTDSDPKANHIVGCIKSRWLVGDCPPLLQWLPEEAVGTPSLDVLTDRLGSLI